MKEIYYWCNKCNMKHSACISKNQTHVSNNGDIVEHVKCKQCGATIAVNLKENKQ